MNRKEYKKWFEKIEENGGNSAFYNKDVSDDLLLGEEDYLDEKSGCRRGHHDWRIGLTAGSDYDKHKEQYREGGPFFDIKNIAIRCFRCGAWGNAEVEVISEGDLSPDSLK